MEQILDGLFDVNPQPLNYLAGKMEGLEGELMVAFMGKSWGFDPQIWYLMDWFKMFKAFVCKSFCVWKRLRVKASVCQSVCV